MSFYCFSRQARGGLSRTQKEEFPSGKTTRGLQWRGISIYWHPNKEIPPQGDRPLPSVLSLLPSVIKTKGKAEKAF
jgi:hypothetical protein